MIRDLSREATHAQLHVLDALRRVTEDGWPATVREVMRAAHLSSPSTAHNHLTMLELYGLALKHPRNQAGGWKPA